MNGGWWIFIAIAIIFWPVIKPLFAPPPPPGPPPPGGACCSEINMSEIGIVAVAAIALYMIYLKDKES